MKANLLFRGAMLPALVGFLLLNASNSALACAACFGDTSGSKQGLAATWGVFAMCIIMFAMLGVVAAFGFYLNYRAKHPLPDYGALLSENDDQPGPRNNT